MRKLLLAILLLNSGCAFLPEVRHKPVVRNPFPQLARVAVAPFFNLSTESTVDGRQFALAYYNELQLVPGYEVVPIGVVESKIEEFKISLGSPQDARKLAQLLGVDAVVVGAVTDFSPYYPPRCGLRVEWHAANPCFHNIPPGYGLPWGTPQEEEIPEPLIFEAEMAMARAQFKSQTPVAPPEALLAPVPAPRGPDAELLPAPGPDGSTPAQPLSYSSTALIKPARTGATANSTSPDLLPTPDHFAGPACVESFEPVLRHTRTYNGHDLHFTQLLKEYRWLQNDKRHGDWDAYLLRSDDFIRFCCHLHIHEMLSARGGAAESQVVWRWPNCR
jgi:hypothetical protein